MKTRAEKLVETLSRIQTQALDWYQGSESYAITPAAVSAMTPSKLSSNDRLQGVGI